MSRRPCVGGYENFAKPIVDTEQAEKYLVYRDKTSSAWSRGKIGKALPFNPIFQTTGTRPVRLTFFELPLIRRG